MGKIRRWGFVFYVWKGVHSPRHVHVLRRGKPILKWDLEKQRAMQGKASRKLVQRIRELEAEGRL